MRNLTLLTFFLLAIALASCNVTSKHMANAENENYVPSVKDKKKMKPYFYHVAQGGAAKRK